MKQLHPILKTLCAAATVCCTLATASAQNIVQDGGFENSPAPNFSAAWTLTPPAGPNAGQQFSNVGTDPAFARSGNNHANLAPDVGSIGSLSQVLSTTTGTAYALSFWLANNSTVPVNFFQVYINGVLLATSAGGNITSPPFANNGVYQQIFANFIAAGGSTTLEFRYRHDDDFWRLDDVSVTRAPEGGAPLWLAIPILGGLCLVHFRMRRAAAQA
jgi:hypothetical protein